MGRDIVITEYGQYIVTVTYADGKMDFLDVSDKGNPSAVGNIYIGKVKDVVKNINAAFIEYRKGDKGYYSLADNPEPVFLNTKNNSKVCQGDEVLIQIAKEKVKTKDPVVSSKLEIAGKYAVLTYGNAKIGYSGKFTDTDKKKELNAELEKYKNDRYGFIIRTNAMNADNEIIIEEIKSLIKTFNAIIDNSKYRTCHTLMYEKQKSYGLYLRDEYTPEDRVITDIREVYEDICSNMPHINIEFYENELQSLTKRYSIEHGIEEILKEKVWLKSGAYLIIQPTEALTVIDVNTGKCIKGKVTDKVFRKVNIEAAYEIARQIRLRNISGIIIIDFINMTDSSMNEELLNIMRELLKKDKIKSNVIDMTQLGLMEITRKKLKPPVYEQIGK